MRMIDSDDPRAAYGAFIRRSIPRAPAPPASPDAWDARLRDVARGLRDAFGLDDAAPCELAPEILGTIDRGDYLIERLTFRSRPGVRVTANLYRPRRLDGSVPGVLCVHGHWPWARIDPVVQARCIGLARLGYVCLCVDAFGAGERAVAPGRGTYHGGPMGASLWAAGVPLIGLQVHDNRRAVDYLISRPEVDSARLAITGASGGGNQTLYAGALDDRLKAVVPVCGVGTYEAYLSAACCVCEVNPGGLRYARTGDLLAMVAPRALLVVSASRDAPQFSAGEAAKSLAYARPRFESLGERDRLRHAVIDSGHDYNRPMREAMYGWLARWLKNEGDGSPVAEPEVQPEEPALLRCYPDAASRPAEVVAIPEFAHREAVARLASLPAPPDHVEAWEAESVTLRRALADVLGGLPEVGPPRPRAAYDPGRRLWTLEMDPEPGLTLRGTLRAPEPIGADSRPRGLVILSGREAADPDTALAGGESWARSGYAACAVELRASGRLKPPTGAVAGAADHNEAEWGVWIGRPLLGQWVYDLLQWVEALGEGLGGLPPAEAERLRGLPITLHGLGAGGTASILAAAYAPRVERVVAERSLVRYVGRTIAPWDAVPMGLIAPNLLKLGDIGRLASLAAPRRLVVRDGIGPDGRPVDLRDLQSAFAHAKETYRLYQAEGELVLAARD